MISTYKVISNRTLAPDIKQIVISAPMVAKKIQPGQFVVIRITDSGERVPLTQSDASPEKGEITIVYQEVGKSTRLLGTLKPSDSVLDLLGPLGVPIELKKYGTIVLLGGGVGVPPLYPKGKALRRYGNYLISIIGARNKDLLVMEEEMKSISDELIVTTDDGSKGRKGFVTDALRDVLKQKKVDWIITVGPLIMMKNASLVAKEFGVKIEVSLNPLMLDATGMCAVCRCTVGDEVKFACVHGPMLDGWKVNFDEVMRRSRTFIDEEKVSMDLFNSNASPAPEEKQKGELAVAKSEAAKGKKLKKRVPMPQRDPKERIKSFKEVALGYTEQDAVDEANRCLQCKESPCCGGCPVCIDIPRFIKAVKEREFAEAIAVIKEQNSLPAICGRVCPQEEQCEKTCTLAKIKEPIAIGRLERFVADYEREKLGVKVPKIPPPTGKTVVVVGSGPAGLTCAGDLAKMGHKVKLFESLHVPGGVLVYGIPEFRLPKQIVKAEVEYIRKLGVEIETNALIGRTYTVDELLHDGFDAIFVGSGAGLPDFLGIPGENSSGVYSSNEFLTRVNLMKAYLFPEYDTPIKVGKRVAVVGGGNTAMDSARCALRLKAEKVTIVYRRSEQELPARKEEVERAKEEGVEFMLLTNPTKIIADEKGYVKQLQCIKMQLGEPDSSGRRRPIPIPGSEFAFDVDTVVIGVGQSPNPLIRQTTAGLASNKIGALEVDPETLMTTRKGIFAGGDIISGGATVIRAMGEGKKAAKAINNYLNSS